MNNLYICMPDTLYVGRYYKLYALPKYGELNNYTYEVTGDCIKNVGANTILVTGVGTITVTAIDEKLGTATKVISCEEVPEPKREKIEYTYTSAEDFKNLIENITTPTEVIFQNDADIVLDKTIYVPYGVLLNFNWKNIKIGATVIEKAVTFDFSQDHCGVTNLKLYSTYPDWSEHSTADKYLQSHTLFKIKGAFFKLENYVCVNRQNFSISVGMAVAGCDLTEYSKTYTWNTDNIETGSCINENGEIVEESDCYYTPNAIAIPTNSKKLGAGFFDGFIKGSVKTYGIAFYDDDENFIESRYGQQFFTGYEIPDGATKCRLMLWGDSELTSSTGMDWSCYLFLFNRYNTENILFKRCRSMENESGMLDFVGGIDGLNIITCVANSGKTNGWAVDFEDGWMMMHNVVVKSCQIKKLVIHSVQGIGVLNCLIFSHIVKSWANGVYFKTCRLIKFSKSNVDISSITVPALYDNCKSETATLPSNDYIRLSDCECSGNSNTETAYNYVYWL